MYVYTVSYPVHEGKVYPHVEGLGTKVDAFGKVHEELMVEGLNPVRIPALQTEIIKSTQCLQSMAAGIHMAGP